MLKRTKIVCTVGPSTDKQGILDKMIYAGMNVARFNFSHGTHEDHAKRISMVRAAAQKAQVPIALMLDTKGPEMRVGKLAGGKVQLQARQSFILTAQDIIGGQDRVSVSYKNLPQEIKSGDYILLADGLIGLLVKEIAGEDIITTVQNSGLLSDNKRVAVPGVFINLPPVSEQDMKDILFGAAQGMDFIAASFVQQASDVFAIRRILEDANSQMGIIAKIENPAGVENCDSILNVADGIMVARGDLGVEIPAEDVPLVQKMLIRKCNEAGKPVITATQMLESMINNPRPTRAEASDVANAIIDGSDAVMLSGETASGSYPVDAVAMMAKIAARTEQSLRHDDILLQMGLRVKCTTTEAVSHATVQMAHELETSAIIAATESGHTARMLSKYRPKCLIVAATPDEKTTRQAQLMWGVYPILVGRSHHTDEIVERSIQAALTAHLIKQGDLVVVTAGIPAGIPGTTNLIRVHVVADVLTRGQGIGQQIASGRVCVINSYKDLDEKLQSGDILVVTGIDERIAPYAARAAAIIAEEGGLTSNAAIVGITNNQPVVVGVEGAVNLLKDDMIITIDTARGLIYRGQVCVK